ncbi:MAG: hypothetical protein M1837_002732 [Sclerophora amabilis]|nr:MAG: hypothetical protein M1837_002732 [Sclerophora amabilis]
MKTWMLFFTASALILSPTHAIPLDEMQIICEPPFDWCLRESSSVLQKPICRYTPLYMGSNVLIVRAIFEFKDDEYSQLCTHYCGCFAAQCYEDDLRHVTPGECLRELAPQPCIYNFAQYPRWNGPDAVPNWGDFSNTKLNTAQIGECKDRCQCGPAEFRHDPNPFQ